MKKILASIVILVAAAVLIGPKLSGMAVERQIRMCVKNAEAETGIPFPTTIAPGWFSSQVATTVDVAQVLLKYMPTLPDSVRDKLTPFMVCTRSEISHGPLPLGDGGFMPALARVVQTSTVQLPSVLAATSLVFTTHATIGFGGTAIAAIDVPEFSVVTEPGITVTVGRITGTSTFGMDLKNVAGSVGIDHLTIGNEDGCLVVKSIASSAITTRTPDMLRIGEQQCTIGSISFPANDRDRSLQLTGLGASQVSRMVDGSLSAAMDFTIQQVVASGKTYGPGALRMTAANIDPVQLGLIRKDFQSLSFGDKQPEEMLVMLQDTLMTNVLRLLQKPLRLELTECSLTLPDGLFRLAASCIPRVGGDTSGASTFDLGLSLSAPKVYGIATGGASTDVIRMSGTLTVAKDLSTINGSVESPGFAVGTERASLSCRGVKYVGDSASTPYGFRIGSMKLSLDTVAVDSPSDSGSLDGLKFNTGAGLSGSLLNGDLHVGFDKLDSETIKMRSAVLDLVIKNIDAPSIATLQDEIKKAGKRGNSVESEAGPGALMEKLPALLAAIVSNRPSVEILKFSIGFPKGAATLTAKASLVPQPGKPVSLDNLDQLVVGELHMAVPAALVDAESPDQPAPLAPAAMFMLKTNNVYRLDVTARNGKATVNGEEAPIGDLMKMMGSGGGSGQQEGGRGMLRPNPSEEEDESE